MFVNGLNENLAARCVVADFKAVGIILCPWSYVAFSSRRWLRKLQNYTVCPQSNDALSSNPQYSTKPVDSSLKKLEFNEEDKEKVLRSGSRSFKIVLDVVLGVWERHLTWSLRGPRSSPSLVWSHIGTSLCLFITVFTDPIEVLIIQCVLLNWLNQGFKDEKKCGASFLSN